jgi:hypothetical protein
VVSGYKAVSCFRGYPQSPLRYIKEYPLKSYPSNGPTVSGGIKSFACCLIAGLAVAYLNSPSSKEHLLL